MYMIFFVLDDPNQLDSVLEAWEKAGIHGATIIESTGLQRRRKHFIPMRYLMQSSGVMEEGHLTLLAIVKDLEMVQACLKATEEIVGDLDEPNSGVMAAWPLSFVKGVPGKKRLSGGG